LAQLTPELAKQLGLRELRGALVQDVVPDAPAAKAGIQPGDVVVKWNGIAVDNSLMLSPLVAATKIGSAVPATVIRDGKPMEIKVTVEERPAELNR
jgi:serine protease Do